MTVRNSNRPNNCLRRSGRADNCGRKLWLLSVSPKGSQATSLPLAVAVQRPRARPSFGWVVQTKRHDACFVQECRQSLLALRAVRSFIRVESHAGMPNSVTATRGVFHGGIVLWLQGKK